MRAAMIANQLRTNNVTDGHVLAALERVPREAFVPAERRRLAYVDVPLPLGNGRALNAPLATSRMIEVANLEPGHAVLLIGAATGYAAALIAALGQSVTALEEDAGLAETARQALAGETGVTIVEGPLNAGWAAGAPYHRILIDGAIEQLPAAIRDQLAEGGRLVTGIVDQGVTRLATGIRAGAALPLLPILDIEIVSLPGFAAPKTFRF